MLNGADAGSRFPLLEDSEPFTIGRQEESHLRLNDVRVSRLHAQMRLQAGQWHIEDCQSTNGTKVNSQPVSLATLQPGDLIRIGQRLLLFVKDGPDRMPSGVSETWDKSQTSAGRSLAGDARNVQLELAVRDSMSRVVRDSTVLCRLANQLHRHQDTRGLLEVAIDALVDGISSDTVAIWLIAADGRPRVAAQRGSIADEEESRVLATLAVERQTGLLDEAPPSEIPSRPDETITNPRSGHALAVPIRLQSGRRGAIHCHRRLEHGPFVTSDLDFAEVVAHQTGLALENLEHRQRLEQANEELRHQLRQDVRMVGSSAGMKNVLDQIARIGPSSATVLILGESGTGKELVARSIHDVSPYREGPYVAVNCAAFTESLLESELFGHEAGSFTGADRRHLGQFERADRGTIFLDEIGEMSLACQAKLLRLLEGQPFQRVGGGEPVHVDCRVIAATHRDLHRCVLDGQLREDLFYRLRVIDVHLPPLRDRGDDVLELASLFLDGYRRQLGRGPQRLSSEAIEAIRAYRWPGNVRELKNAIERAVVLGREEEVAITDLGLASQPGAAPPADRLISLREAERRHIDYVLEQVEGNKTRACKILGIGRATLYARLQEEIEAS